MRNEQYSSNVLLKERFGGYLPVVIDVETGGLEPLTNPLLEIAAISIGINQEKEIHPGELFSCHILPFKNSILDPISLAITKIDPFHPFRFAIKEKRALQELFVFVEKAVSAHNCRRAVLVGHNAHFDLSFIHAAMKRCKIKTSPLHAFTCFDTATLAATVFGKSVLAKALREASIPFDRKEAHSAIYDAKRTSELFCYIINRIDRIWQREKPNRLVFSN
ncbi:ribonuclease T [Coxiella endosymbiont of Amblyomma sculptum]|uniref:exonuclease domain-containing protein n=1 Tax=Coxiella endosymbiont of Amblyomma sculptum TaxID=2487929 RepID=UPI00132E97A9|nr:exonuclease domain-containing protein [Coxiella endosymbiont of Amblyomma sculptum]QHG92670.1 ribonuclease T [Coxiella endosymbiont of Amblyomma sculptum]